MIVNFGKHQGKHISEIPDDYLNWAANNLSSNELRQQFQNEVKNRTKKKYDRIIFGKNSTENIVNISYKNESIYIYFADDTFDKIQYMPWTLTSYGDSSNEKLTGNQYYKYVNYHDNDTYLSLVENREKGHWFPRGIEEGFMLKEGYTHFKSMKMEDMSVLSFDIEATGLNGEANNAEVLMISNTFRDRNGKVIKKLFDLKEHDSDIQMIKEWCNWVREQNPDTVIGHNILGYDLPYLNARCSLNLGKDESNLTFDRHISKFRKDGSQQYEYHNAKIHGRTIIDTMFLSIKYDIGRDFPSYGLKKIEQHLGLVDENRIDWDFNKYPTKNYKNWPKEKWVEFKQYCIDDGDSPLKMLDIMLPPFFYLCQSVPKTLQQMINEASGSQLDSLMIRAYLQEGKSQPKTSQKEEFEGAISMGVPGVYENVVKVDVASLYPSIMLEYEIYDRKKDPEKNMLYMLKYFRDERLNNKRLTKETGEKYYDDMQAAQKIMINSMYGFLGAGYLLYNYPFGAAQVTRKGREILLKGVEWATGHTLKKVIKSIRNEGKENEEIKYHWVVGNSTNKHAKHFKLVNVDTDSFSVDPGYRVTDKEYKDLVDELNSLYPKLIVWEDDGLFDKVIVVKAKNYVLKTGDKIKYKGSSITDQKKEPALTKFLKDVINAIINEENDAIKDIFKKQCLAALNPTDIRDWTVKKTITQSVLQPERLNEQKVLDACNEAIGEQIIQNIQEGDKVWLYQAIDGEKQKVVKGEPVFLKDGTPKMESNTLLRFPELYKNDHDKWHYVQRVYKTLEILDNIVDMSQFEKYHLKAKRKLLCP